MTLQFCNEFWIVFKDLTFNVTPKKLIQRYQVNWSWWTYTSMFHEITGPLNISFFHGFNSRVIWQIHNINVLLKKFKNLAIWKTSYLAVILILWHFFHVKNFWYKHLACTLLTSLLLYKYFYLNKDNLILRICIALKSPLIVCFTATWHLFYGMLQMLLQFCTWNSQFFSRLI